MSVIVTLSFCFAANLAEKEEELILELPFGTSEQNRLRMIKRNETRFESLAALVALKNILPTGLTNTEITRLIGGKPIFSDAPYFFNLSHSDGLSVAAINDKPIGIDLEWIDNSRAFMKIAQKFFSVEEYEFLNASDNKSFDFFSLWTKYEAMAKMSGCGLAEVCASPLSNSLFFKQIIIKQGQKTAILSICTEKPFEHIDIYNPYKELLIL